MWNLPEIRTKIERAWCAETSYEPEAWEFLDPAWGQCAVTACLLWELVEQVSLETPLHKVTNLMYKGTVINQDYGISGSHYWNYIAVVHTDLTWRQFPAGSKIIPPTGTNTYQVVWYEDLSKSVKKRLDLLRTRYEELI